ncbi:MAG: GNAT family N-acetyltransferase [Rubrivivax sp.]|nr:GNAT family N-acetyltransferase [Rubrivivax sp.]
MPERIVIRRENPDQPEVVALLAELDSYLESLYPPEANHILDLQALLGADVDFFVARDGEQAVATGALRRRAGGSDTGGVPYGEVKRMYVAPAWRGQRIAAQVLAVMEVALRAQGYGLALLETGRHQAEAVKLYERCGYTPRAPFGGYPGNGLSAFYGKAL